MIDTSESNQPPVNEKMLKKLCNDIRSNPQNHTVFIGTTVSIVIGLCAWQYCRGYFKALGINISYAHVDNLIFAFEQISRVSLKKSDDSNLILPSVLLIGGSIIFMLVSVVRSNWEKLKRKLAPRSEQDLRNDPDYQYWSSVISFYCLFIAASYFLNLAISSFLAWIVILLALLMSMILFVRDIWTRSHNRTAYRPLFWLVMILLPINMFYHLGRIDGERVTKSEYRYLDTICLSEPAQELDVTNPKTGFQLCGKLIYSDSQQFCIKERTATYPLCRHREKYEATIIPNDP